MGTSTLARLDRLEVAFGGGGKCITCYNHPVRIAYLDEDSDEVFSENMPVDGCPACGRPVVSELHIVGVDPNAD